MRSVLQVLSKIVITLWLSTLSISSYGAMPHSATRGHSLNTMLKLVIPTVVNVAAVGSTTFVPVLPHTAPAQAKPQQHQFQSLGSGVIVDSQHGIILTNAHVVAQSKDISITLHDGRHAKAKLLGADEPSDIAVLQVKISDLTAIKTSDSDRLAVGDYVVAIGNPFDLNRLGPSQTVTSGIVSALGRNNLNIEGHHGYENFIQTDAAINSGNSGGPLVNLEGELVGINTAIISRNGGSIGIGFAIPTNMALSVAQQIIQFGEVKRGQLGVLAQNLTPELAKVFKAKLASGAIVTQIAALSPAATVGIRPGDIIESINHKPIDNAASLRNAIGLLRVGTKLKIKVLRKGEKLSFTPTIVDPKTHLANVQKHDPFLFGLAMENFDGQIPNQGRLKGIFIYQILRDSAAWRAGVRPGDIISEVNQKAVKDISTLQNAVKQTHGPVLFTLIRGSQAFFVVLERG